MTISNMLTRDQARAAFEANLTYSQVCENDIRALQGYLCIEYAQHERDGEHMCMQPTYRKKAQPKFNVSEEGGMENAFLRVSGFYFSDREAISFNRDGFIGFAGWADDADDTNVQPFLRGFMRWLREWKGCTRSIPRIAASASAPAAALEC